MSTIILPNPLPAWIQLQPTPTLPKYELIRVVYISPESSINNNSTNIYTKFLDKNGDYQAGIKVWQDWKDDRAFELTKPLKDAPDFNGEKFGCTFYMSGDSSFDPNKGQSGPYSVYPDQTGDRVNGLGLPLKRHVQYLLTWQWTDKPTPPPVDAKWVITEQTPTRLVLEFIKS